MFMTANAVTAAVCADFVASGASVLPRSVVTTLLAYLSFATLGLLCPVTIRNSGPTNAVWFFWIALGGHLIPALVTRLARCLQPVVAYLPFTASQKVLPSTGSSPARSI